jgi:carbon-monoxide dehydrogenase medium subunit
MELSLSVTLINPYRFGVNMYPAPFKYHRAQTVDDAVGIISSIGDGARALAGGQSFLAILKLRFDEPTDLVDIGRIAGLNQIEQSGDHFKIGALATHNQIGASSIADAIPIVRDCAYGIADNQVRNRGTIGGSVASGDPSCDWPTLLHTLDAEIHCQGPNGSRSLSINGFVEDLYQTLLGQGELITGISFNRPAAGSGGAYCTFKRCSPAYPTIAVGTQLCFEDGQVSSARVALGSAGLTPIRAQQAEAELVGGNLSPEQVNRAAEAAVAASDPHEDQRGSVEFKRQLVDTLTKRAIGIAKRRADGEVVLHSPEYY